MDIILPFTGKDITFSSGFQIMNSFLKVERRACDKINEQSLYIMLKKREFPED